MRQRPLASTGLHLSSLGLGTVKFGRNQQVKYPTAFDLPTDAEILELLDVARSEGINLLDTAPAFDIRFHSSRRVPSSPPMRSSLDP